MKLISILLLIHAISFSQNHHKVDTIDYKYFPFETENVYKLISLKQGGVELRRNYGSWISFWNSGELNKDFRSIGMHIKESDTLSSSNEWNVYGKNEGDYLCNMNHLLGIIHLNRKQNIFTLSTFCPLSKKKIYLTNKFKILKLTKSEFKIWDCTYEDKDRIYLFKAYLLKLDTLIHSSQ